MEGNAMATRTAAPAKRTPAKRAPAKVQPAPEPEVENAEAEDTEERFQYDLTDYGRTKNGTGKQKYFNLHERGARGQIFVDLDVTRVAILIIRDRSIDIQEILSADK